MPEPTTPRSSAHPRPDPGGETVRVDAASLIAFPASVLGRGEDADHAAATLMDQVMGDEPLLVHVLHTGHGDIGLYMIPVSDRELFRDRRRAEEAACKGIALAAAHGARTVSLTGMIPAGTDYGHALQRALDERAPPTAAGWPRLTTGHAAVVAAFQLNVERLLALTDRRLSGERAAFIGLGSIGAGLLDLMMSQDERPGSVLLVDVESKRTRVEEMRQALRERFGYDLPVDIELVTGDLPDALYRDISLYLTATSSEEVVDVDKMRPGSLLVDDSFPLGFSAERAVERIRRDKDILITIAGAFSTPGQPLTWSEAQRGQPDRLPGMRARLESSARIDDVSLTGCIYSSVLTEPLELPHTLGAVTAEDGARFYEAFKRAGFQGTRPYVITPRSETGSYFIDDDVIARVKELGAP